MTDQERDRPREGRDPHDVDPATAPVAEDPLEDEVRAAAERDAQGGRQTEPASTTDRLIAAVTGTNVRVTGLALLSAAIIGAVIIAFSEESVRETMSYFFSRPGDFLAAAWTAAADAYSALVRGSLGGRGQLSETAVAAIPLILTGLAVAVPLRAGMFNIGAEGQVIGGGLVAGYLGFALTGLPLIVHLPIAVLGGIVGGALVGFIPGILKARTGAHEVITTIMLNNIMFLVTDYALASTAFQQPGRSDPISKTVLTSARLPRIFDGLRVHYGLLLVIAAAIVIWYMLERSTSGFELAAVGMNPNAATSAGMSVPKMIVFGMAVAGGLAGLAGGTQILGVGGRITSGFSSGLGFDGITVALLGRGSVGGTVAAGALFGALKAGGRAMQAETGTSLDLVVVVQALIILFVAAPALVRAIYRIRTDGAGTGQVAKGWGA